MMGTCELNLRFLVLSLRTFPLDNTIFCTGIPRERRFHCDDVSRARLHVQRSIIDEKKLEEERHPITSQPRQGQRDATHDVFFRALSVLQRTLRFARHAHRSSISHPTNFCARPSTCSQSTSRGPGEG